MAQLRKLEMKRADYVKTEKTKKEVEKLESQMMVASQAIETTSAEIIKLRETELYPQLIELVKGLVFFYHFYLPCSFKIGVIDKQLTLEHIRFNRVRSQLY